MPVLLVLAGLFSMHGLNGQHSAMGGAQMSMAADLTNGSAAPPIPRAVPGPSSQAASPALPHGGGVLAAPATDAAAMAMLCLAVLGTGAALALLALALLALMTTGRARVAAALLGTHVGARASPHLAAVPPRSPSARWRGSTDLVAGLCVSRT